MSPIFDSAQEAERLVEEANVVGHENPERGAGMIAAAQVHALLAVNETLKDIAGTLDAIRDWGTGQTLPKARP